MSNDIVKQIFDILYSGKSVILHGPGGVGKSYTFREAVRRFRNEYNLNVALTTSTGIAAVNLSENFSESYGRSPLIATTVFRWGIGDIADKPISELIHKITSRKHIVERWKTVNVLFIDEISMIGEKTFSTLSFLAKHFRQNNEPFGGIKLVLGGDFFQLPPVRQEWIFKSDEWKQISFQIIEMNEPKRYPDPNWFHVLLRARIGELSESDDCLFRERKKAYDEYRKMLQESHSELRVIPSRLYCINADVDRYNYDELRKLPGKTMRFKATDEIEWRENKGGKGKTKDYYSKFLDDAICDVIELKPGAQVMLKWNMDTDAGLANGSRGVVTHIEGFTVFVKWQNGMHTPVDVNTWIKQDDDATAYRTQIPLVLAWAVTIHKSQGCTLDNIIIDIGKGVFTAGQAYVALSRVRSVEGLFIEDYIKEKIYADVEVKDYLNQIKE